VILYLDNLESVSAQVGFHRSALLILSFLAIYDSESKLILGTGRRIPTSPCIVSNPDLFAIPTANFLCWLNLCITVILAADVELISISLVYFH
jgi:hypothetical protein